MPSRKASMQHLSKPNESPQRIFPRTAFSTGNLPNYAPNSTVAARALATAFTASVLPDDPFNEPHPEMAEITDKLDEIVKIAQESTESSRQLRDAIADVRNRLVTGDFLILPRSANTRPTVNKRRK
jgi:hypothetical protein